MKTNRLLATIGLAAALGAPIAAEAQFNGRFNGFFAAQPFVFRTMGFRPVFTSPFGNPYANLIGLSPLAVNPAFTGHLGASFGGFGPIPNTFTSGIFPSGGVGLGFSNAAFPGAGTAMNPGFDPRFGNQFAANANGFNPAFPGAFVTPGGAVIPSTVNGLGTTIIDRGIGAPMTPTTFVGDAAVNGNVAGSTQVNSQLAQDLVSARIEGGRLVIRYTGDISVVRSITFSLLDRNRKPLKVQIINRTPAEAWMTLTSRTEFYRVNIEYIDGRNQIVEGRV